jgi:hypothetical protein
VACTCWRSTSARAGEVGLEEAQAPDALRHQRGDRLRVLAADRVARQRRLDAHRADDAIARAERHVPGVEPGPSPGAGTEHRRLVDAAAQGALHVLAGIDAWGDRTVDRRDQKDRTGDNAAAAHADRLSTASSSLPAAARSIARLRSWPARDSLSRAAADSRLSAPRGS